VPWRVTVRVGPRVERATHPSLQAALRAVEARATRLAQDVGRAPVDVRYRRFEPAQQVAARLELAGPQRLLPSIRAGIDVHGDGSSEAYLGRVRRQVVKARRRESAVEALRRELAGAEAASAGG
jgi:hypothetical protein